MRRWPGRANEEKWKERVKRDRIEDFDEREMTTTGDAKREKGRESEGEKACTRSCERDVSMKGKIDTRKWKKIS